MEEALKKSISEFMPPESARKAREQFSRVMKSFEEGPVVTALTDYYDYICKDGSVKTVESALSFLYGPVGRPSHILGVSRDATERVRNSTRLKAALRESETLHWELEHRVKNTLAMIASLLALASEQVKDPADALLFEESQARVSALTLVYQKLLCSADASHIDLGVYLEDLCKSMISVFSPEENFVDLRVERKELTVGSKKAALIGLAVNEMITNSLKYAVRQGSPLVLRLEVCPLQDGTFVVAFQDNGPGLPEGFDMRKSGGLGILLVRSMVEQLKGELVTESSGSGARFVMTVPAALDDKVAEPPADACL